MKYSAYVKNRMGAMIEFDGNENDIMVTIEADGQSVSALFSTEKLVQMIKDSKLLEEKANG